MLLAARAERTAWWRETVYAVQDGAYWAWLVAAVAAAVVWVARGMPSSATAGAAAGAAVIGAAAAAWRTVRRHSSTDGAERRAAARIAWRRWLALYGAAAALIPAVLVGAVLPAAIAVAALAELAIVTIPVRSRRRLLARIRIGAAAVAGDEDVRVGRALWSGRWLDQIYIWVPVDWATHRQGRRDELVERSMWDVCGPPPRTPAEAIARPDYLSTWSHIHSRLEIQRVPSLPRLLAARDWGPRDAIVLGQTTVEAADIVVDDVPLATYVPDAHMLVTGATSFGKSSGVRAWAVDGLTHGVWPGGVWGIDGKQSGSLAPLLGRRGVHAIAHSTDEWRQVILQSVAPTVAARYEEMLAWRAGRADRAPHHPRALLIIDEIQQVILACPNLLPVIDTLARQAMEAGVRLWILTQRPDAKDAVPGAIRDQLVDRCCFGPLSSAGAKMTFDVAGDDWHRALGVAPVRGRALIWLSGVWRTVQAPWLPIPADHPEAEPFYPQRVSQGSAGPRPETTRPGRVERDQEDEPLAPPPPASAAYDPTDPHAHRRRRRRRD